MPYTDFPTFHKVKIDVVASLPWFRKGVRRLRLVEWNVQEVQAYQQRVDAGVLEQRTPAARGELPHGYGHQGCRHNGMVSFSHKIPENIYQRKY